MFLATKKKKVQCKTQSWQFQKQFLQTKREFNKEGNLKRFDFEKAKAHQNHSKISKKEVNRLKKPTCVNVNIYKYQYVRLYL